MAFVLPMPGYPICSRLRLTMCQVVLEFQTPKWLLDAGDADKDVPRGPLLI